MPSPEMLVLSTLALVAVIAVVIVSLNQRKRGRRRTPDTESLIRLDARVADETDIHPVLESEEALYSIEKLELASDDAFRRAPLIFSPEAFLAEELKVSDPETAEPVAEDAPLNIALPVEEEETPDYVEAVAEETEILAVEETADEALTPIIGGATPAWEIEEEVDSPTALLETAPEEHPTAAVEEVDETLAAEEEALRRATLRRAPRRHRRPRTVDENLDSQISDLDHRLDALEALVASIEQGLAEFEPLLEDIDAGMDPLDDDLSEHGDDHAQAA